VPAVLAVIASIPSPSSGTLSIGPLNLRAYGLMIALGVIAAVWLSSRRLERTGLGTADDMSAIALWAVPAGVIGARIYHVVTDWQLFRDDPIDAFKIWKGGLGIWGGIALGVLVGVWMAKRRGIPMGWGLFVVAPALALAQAIGRWGNWFNQELFGRPTDVAWALEIDERHRPDGFEQFSTFHPTFLYESLWNLLLCGALIWIGRRWVKRPEVLFAWYVAGYTFMRFFLERLRIDPANTIAGLRVNEWTSLVLFAVAAAFILRDVVGRRGERVATPPVRAGVPPDGCEPLPSSSEPLEDPGLADENAGSGVDDTGETVER
jgi:prolipoprotein diacylglyceryl transferase